MLHVYLPLKSAVGVGGLGGWQGEDKVWGVVRMGLWHGVGMCGWVWGYCGGGR